MTSRAALVVVTTSFPMTSDGSEAAGSFVSDFAEELAQHVPVRVVAPGLAGTREQWADSVDLFRFKAPGKPLSALNPLNPSDLRAIHHVLKTGSAATQEALRAGPTAHILALWALPSGHWARLAARATGVPYSVWTLGSDIWSLGRIPLVRSYLRRVLREAHTCYSDGLKLADDTRRICGREVEFLPSTRRIENTRTAPLSSAPPYRLLFLGRWHPNKGVDLLIDALNLLSDEDWQRIKAVEISGGGPMEAEVAAGAEALRAIGRPVELRGYLAKPAAEEAILRADYLLIPSRIESIPVVFSDASKLRCPVVAMPVGDLELMVTAIPACGVLAEEVSGPAFCRAIRAALASAPSAFDQGLARVTERFDMARIGERLCQRLLGYA